MVVGYLLKAVRWQTYFLRTSFIGIAPRQYRLRMYQYLMVKVTIKTWTEAYVLLLMRQAFPF